MFQDEAEQEPYLDPETNVLSAGGGTCAGEGGQEATDFERIVLSVLSDVLQKKEINEQEKYCVQQCFETTYTDADGNENVPTQGNEVSKKEYHGADAVALEFRPWAKPIDRCKCFYDCPMMGYLGSSLVRPRKEDVVGAGPWVGQCDGDLRQPRVGNAAALEEALEWAAVGLQRVEQVLCSGVVPETLVPLLGGHIDATAREDLEDVKPSAAVVIARGQWP